MEKIKFSLADLDRLVTWGMAYKDNEKYSLDDGALFYKIAQQVQDLLIQNRRTEQPTE